MAGRSAARAAQKSIWINSPAVSVADGVIDATGLAVVHSIAATTDAQCQGTCTAAAQLGSCRRTLHEHSISSIFAIISEERCSRLVVLILMTAGRMCGLTTSNDGSVSALAFSLAHNSTGCIGWRVLWL